MTMIAPVEVSEQLAGELRAYQLAFDHVVPVEIVQQFARRPGLLVMEIRQAVALRRPVRAWLERSKVASTSPPPEWYTRGTC